MRMTKSLKLLSCIAAVFAFCFLGIGYAVVQDELIINGSVSVDGYVYVSIDCSDALAYVYDSTTKTVTINDTYYDPSTGKNYKVIGIDENGFSATAISDAKKENSELTIDVTELEAFKLSENISTIGANAFNGLSNLTTFTVAAENTFFEFDNADGLLFAKNEDGEKNTLVYYSSANQANYYTVPDYVTSITDGAFSNNNKCTAIVTALYDDNAWGAVDAVMINTSKLIDTIVDITGNINDGYNVYLQDAKVNEGVVLQGLDHPDIGYYGDPVNETVQAGEADSNFIKIESTLCQPCTTHNHSSQIYLSSWQEKIAYAYLTEDKTLEIHNCKTAMVGGKIYQWVGENDTDHRTIPNENLYELPSGTVTGSQLLPEGVAVNNWTAVKEQVKTLKVVDDIAPSSVTNWFRDMTACTTMELTKLDTENVTSMSYMFSGCRKVISLDLSHFNTSNVTNMQYMFSNCITLTELDVSVLDTSKAERINNMFAGCSNLQTLDVSTFDTSSTKHMQQMFIECTKLRSLNLTGFKTTGAMSMYGMFSSCASLTEIDLSGFDTLKATNLGLYYMFHGCSSLTSLDLSSFDTKNITDMTHMFYQCTNLEKIIVSDKFVTTKASSSKDIFNGCTNLVGGNGTTLKSVQAAGVTAADSYQVTYAKIDTAEAPGYFTLKSAD